MSILFPLLHSLPPSSILAFAIYFVPPVATFYRNCNLECAGRNTHRALSTTTRVFFSSACVNATRCCAHTVNVAPPQQCIYRLSVLFDGISLLLRAATRMSTLLSTALTLVHTPHIRLHLGAVRQKNKRCASVFSLTFFFLSFCQIEMQHFGIHIHARVCKRATPKVRCQEQRQRCGGEKSRRILGHRGMWDPITVCTHRHRREREHFLCDSAACPLVRYLLQLYAHGTSAVSKGKKHVLSCVLL